jgi:hypothetical protein
VETPKVFDRGLPPALRTKTLQSLAFVVQVGFATLVVSEFTHWIFYWLGLETVLLWSCAARWLTAAFSVYLWLIVPKSNPSPAQMVFFYRVWFFVFSLCCTYTEFLVRYEGHVLGISRACITITLASVLIPSGRLRNLVSTAGLCMTMPLGYYLARCTGADPLRLSEIFSYAISNLIPVSGAWVTGATVEQLRKSLQREYGDYHLLRKLGQGGFGEVWLAESGHGGQKAALKLLKDVGDESQRERFFREASALSSLTCPFTVRLLSYGQNHRGVLYLAMEYLQGMDLEQLVKSHGPQPANRVANLLSQAALALDEAHQRGLIHRDVKPSNLYLSEGGLTGDMLKVLDFGLVKREMLNNVTQSGSVVGSPECMSPEAILGQPADGRSDLYSLGCVGYYLLTGRHVFVNESTIKVIFAHLHSQPEPIESPDPEDQKLWELIFSCLSKEPGNRPASAGELFRALRSLAQVSPFKAGPWWRGLSPTEA